MKSKFKNNYRTGFGNKIYHTRECLVCRYEWSDLEIHACKKCLQNKSNKQRLKPLDQAFKKLDEILKKKS